MTHLWLEIAMNDTMMTKKRQRPENLNGEATDEGGREPGEAVRLDQFVKVDAEEFSHDTEMTSEGERVDHADDEVFLIRIL